MLLGGSGTAAHASPVSEGAGTARPVAYASAAHASPVALSPAATGSAAQTAFAPALPGSPASGRAGSRAGAPTRGTAAPSVEEHPCPVAVPSGTTCGYLLAPERRDVPNSRTIKVGYAVHRAAGATSQQAADPVVYMSGGPGSASLQLTGFLTRMFPGRDLVVLEQRGGRYSEPRLSCPEIVRGIVDTLRTPGPTASETAPLVRQSLACQSRLEAQNVDLRGYRTAEIAADVVDLRSALGYPQWYLFGVGYSTRPMLLAAARDPQGTRGVVLDSLLPSGAHWYDESSAALSATMTKLGIAARFDAMVKELNAHPASYETRDPLTRERLTVRLNGDDAATILGEALHEADRIPIVPALVDGLASGHTGLLQPLVDAAGDGLTSREWGLYYAVQCQDQVPYNTFRHSRGPRLFTGVVDAAVCNAWGLPAARAEADLLTPRTPVTPASTDDATDTGMAGASGSESAAGADSTSGADSAAGPDDATGTGGTAGTDGMGGGAGMNDAPGANGAMGTGGAMGAASSDTERGGPADRSLALNLIAATEADDSSGAATAQDIPPILVLSGGYDAITPPEAARQAVSAVPGAQFAEFAGVGHSVFLSSGCGRQTIAAFLDDPSATPRPCDPAAAPHALVRPGDLTLTSSVYRLSQTPIPLAVPAAFLLVSVVQLLAGLVRLIRKRDGVLSVLAGLAGVVLCGLSALSLSAVQDWNALVIGVPHALAWYGLLALVSTGLSIVEAFRLNAAAARIVPALTGLAFLAWLYGWLLA